MTNISKLFTAILVLFVTSLVTTATASMCTADGSTTTCENDFVIYEYENNTLFGEALGIDADNQLVFLIGDMSASKSNMPGTTSLRETLDVKITVKEGTLASLNIFELGDYKISQGQNVEADLGTFVTEPMTGFDSDQFSSLNENSPNDGTLTEWSLENTHELSGEATMANLLIQNLLLARISTITEFALIDKKRLEIGYTVVPLPAAVWMFGSVLATLGLFRKKAAAKA
jgi:hypothetical protein